MSESYIIQLIKNVLSSENALRQKSEHQLSSLLQSEPNGLFSSLCALLMPNNSIEIKTFAIIYIRKNLSNFSQISNNLQKLTAPTISQLKVSLFKGLEEPSSNYRNILCDSLGEIGASFISFGLWEELVSELLNLLQKGELNGVDFSLRTLSSMCAFGVNDWTPQVVGWLSLYIGNPPVSLGAVALLTSIIQTSQPKELEGFQKLIPQFLQILASGLNFSEMLGFMQEMVEAEPKIFKKYADTVMEMMKNIVFDASKEQGLKEQAIEIIINILERIPSIFKNHENKLKSILEMIISTMVSMDFEVNQSWEKPQEGFSEIGDDSNDDVIRIGIQNIDRIIGSVGQNIMLPILSDIVLKMFYFGEQNNDWRYKHAAIMALSQVGEYIDDISEVEPILNRVLSFHKDSNSKIRYSVCHCIGQIADDMKPDFQEHYHEKVIVDMYKLLNDPIPRVQAHAACCLTNLFEGMTRQQLKNYMLRILQKFIELLQNSSSIVKQAVVQAIAALSQSAKEDIVPYYEDVTTFLFKMIETHQQAEYKELRGQIIETQTMMASAVQWPNFQKFAPALIDLMIHIQNSNMDDIDPQKAFLITGWERLSCVMAENFSVYLPKILPSLFNLIKKIFSINNIFSLQSTKTSETDEGEICIKMLFTIIDNNKNYFFPYIESTLQILIPLITSNNNDEIRRVAIQCMPQIVQVALIKDKNAAIRLAVQVMNIIWKNSETETMPDILQDQVLGISDCFAIINEKFLSETDLKEIQIKIFKMLMESDKRKQENETQKKENDLEAEEIQNIDNDNLQEDELHISISELIGILFKTQKESSMNLANAIYNTLLSKALQLNQSAQIHRFAINIINDMLEYLGISLIGDKFEHLSEALVTYATDRSWEVRQAVCQGIGIIALKYPNNFLNAQKTYIQKIKEAFLVTKKNETNKIYEKCKDRILSSLLVIIQILNPESFEYKNTLNFWIERLPMKADKLEYIDNHLWLAKTMNNKPEDIICNDTLFFKFSQKVQQVIKILSQILDTKYSNKEINSLIKQALQKLKQNNILQQNWEYIAKQLSSFDREKMEVCFLSL